MHALSLRSLISFFSCLLVGLLLWLVGFLHYYWHTPISKQEDVIIRFYRGSSFRSVATNLASYDIIRFPVLFELISRGLSVQRYFYAGEYSFVGSVTPADIYKKLIEGEVYYRQITFPEGWNIKQILSQIENDDHLLGDITIDIAEGMALPDTYYYTFGDTREGLINIMQERMLKLLRKEWPSRDKDLPLRSIDEVLVLASIVEKETALDSERSRVAAVFINRLKQGMRLQADPTVIYALTEGQQDNLGRRLSKKDLRIDSPYNTYKYSGLPPTPIACPGVDSILAVLHPARTEDLYFVADGKGGHSFATTLAEHNRNVTEYRNMRVE